MGLPLTRPVEAEKQRFSIPSIDDTYVSPTATDYTSGGIGDGAS
jgi:hypothetical protein